MLDPQPADVQDRDGAVPVLKQSRRSYPFIAKAFADAGYAGDRPASATLITVEIVHKPPGQVEFIGYKGARRERRAQATRRRAERAFDEAGFVDLVV